jgi:hypothetical protein
VTDDWSPLMSAEEEESSEEGSDGEGSGGDSTPTPRVSATYTGAFRV